MTEKQWLNRLTLEKALKYLESRGSHRKRRLLALAFCKRITRSLPASQVTPIMAAIESYADGLSNEEELERAMDAASELFYKTEVPGKRAASSLYNAASSDNWDVADLVVRSVKEYVEASEPPDRHEVARQAETRAQLALVREVFGNPFRPVPFDAAWRTTDVMLLANGI